MLWDPVVNVSLTPFDLHFAHCNVLLRCLTGFFFYFLQFLDKDLTPSPILIEGSDFKENFTLDIVF